MKNLLEGLSVLVFFVLSLLWFPFQVALNLALTVLALIGDILAGIFGKNNSN